MAGSMALLLAATLFVLSGSAWAEDGLGVLVYSKTDPLGFRHGEAIVAANEILSALAEEEGWAVEFTEDENYFTVDNIAQHDVVVFNNTSQNVLPMQSQRDALQSHIRSGGGFVGIHAATDTLYDWKWYGRLVGAYFKGHPHGMHRAIIVVEDQGHPTMRGMAGEFEFYDEWYWFQSNPREHVHVLATLDRKSNEVLIEYDPETVADHPIIWCHEFDGGRAWYTALGHDRAQVRDKRFVEMLRNGIAWAAGR